MITNGFPGGGEALRPSSQDLSNLKRAVTVRDANGCPTTITFSRANDTLSAKRVYSNPITADLNKGLYRTCTEYFYAANGSTLLETHVYTLSYDSYGVLDSSTVVITTT